MADTKQGRRLGAAARLKRAGRSMRWRLMGLSAAAAAAPFLAGLSIPAATAAAAPAAMVFILVGAFFAKLERVTERLRAVGEAEGASAMPPPFHEPLEQSEMKRLDAAVSGLARDVHDSRRRRDAAEHEALHDALTGLANRRLLQRTLEKRATDPAWRAEPIAVLHIDLDRFKEINDTLGHSAGDFVLAHAAAVLRSVADPSDVVARIGGDEFVVLRRGRTDRTALRAFADDIIDRLAEPVRFRAETCRFGASIGVDVIMAGVRGEDAGRILQNADIALYRAKELGRGRVEFFEETLLEEVRVIKRTSDELSLALKAGELKPFFQGQYDRDGALCGAEALVRWTHPARGVLGPDAFMSIAERIGAVRELDEAVMWETLATLDHWEANGLRLPSISVNLSAKRLTDPRLIEQLKAMELPRGRIVFELLETYFTDRIDNEVRHTLDCFREAGIGIDLDDFGTGHSALTSLLSVGPDRVKIPRELIAPSVYSLQHRKLVEAILDIAAYLKIGVVAEGVETKAHWEMLRKAGCDVMQGYYFSKPVDAETFLRMHVKQRAETQA
ncbi:MAG: bifunctional diguanylate cyclase/phosphodiesterase [Pseudomonadota bacterium]